MTPSKTLSRRALAKWAASLPIASALSLDSTAQIAGGVLSLVNPFVKVSWRVANGALTALHFMDLPSNRTIPFAPDAFSLILEGGRTLKSSELKVVGAPRTGAVKGNPRSIRRAGQRSGRQLSLQLIDPESGAAITWRAILLDKSRYLRQEVSIQAGARDVPVREVVLWDLDLAGAEVRGTVKGSPAVAGSIYLALEHPLSSTQVTDGRVRCSLSRVLPIRAGQSFACSSVIGATGEGQLRRGFLEYVEDQRAHPYRTFLHYNSWYDIGYFSRYDEALAVDRINAFGVELHQKRGVTLSSFLFDDGWDDPFTLWKFNPGFPNGFSGAAKAAASYQAATGVWLSPWGGYGKPKQERVANGAAAGYEVRDGGFALSGPNYYRYFHETCLRMIREYGVNQFKIDGTGNADQVIAGSQFDSDFDAAISLIADLRAAKPGLFVNLTTGTYPSPFWLRYADSIWRGAEDHDFAGVGTWRQRWITYRDAMTFQHTVSRGPLFPINSLMLHGMIYAKHARNLGSDPDGDFRSEVRSYFGTGTQLQEMYISPELLSSGNWTDLAEAARWSHKNADILADTHWIGGDPGKLEVYGWASWGKAKGILSMRNPSDHEQTFAVDIQQAFELPAGAAGRYRAASAWQDGADQTAIDLQAGQLHEFRLAPFEVVNLEAAPVSQERRVVG